MNENIKAGADIHAGDGGYQLGTQEEYDEFVKKRNQSLAELEDPFKEIADKAHFNIYHSPMWKPTAHRFAEMIVKECVQVSLNSSHRDDDMGAIIARQIKKHFGVEE
jgi:hypothetical protein